MTDTSDVGTPAHLPDDLGDDTKEDVEFRPNGGVKLWIGGKPHRLRNPRIREYRRLKEAWEDGTDELMEQARQAQAWTLQVQDARSARWLAEHPEEPDGLDAPTPEELAEDRKRGREQIRFREDMNLAWWAEAIEVLGSGPIDTDDLPAFMTDYTLVNKVFDHWQTVPSLSGSRAR